MKKYLFPNGCMWEGGTWSIEMDYQCEENDGGEPCKHCHSEQDEPRTYPDGTPYTRRIWICPRVVIAYNEGGCNCTGVCLDCILEAAASIGLSDQTLLQRIKDLEKQIPARTFDVEDYPR